MSITSTLIGSMGSINTALTAMGVSDLQSNQEDQQQRAAAMGASQEAAQFRQTEQDSSDLVKQAREMSKESGTYIPRDVLQAAHIGREEKAKSADKLLKMWYPKLVAQANKGGVREASRLNIDLQHYLREYDKEGYTGPFEAYHKRMVKQRAKEDLERKKLQKMKYGQEVERKVLFGKNRGER